MIFDVFITVLLGVATLSMATFAYVYLLLGIDRIFSGAFKFILGTIVYFAFSVVLVAPLAFLLFAFGPALDRSDWALIYVLVAYAIICTPTFYYIFKIKIEELRKAGYFLP